MNAEIKKTLDKLLECRDFSSLSTVLTSTSFTIENLIEFIKFDERCYSRNYVLKTDLFEILVLCWRPGHGSKVHNHGTSKCVFKVIEGCLIDKHYFLKGNNNLEAVSLTKLNPTDSGVISRENCYHQISNDCQENAISIHLYSPPLEQYKVIDNAHSAVDSVELV